MFEQILACLNIQHQTRCNTGLRVNVKTLSRLTLLDGAIQYIKARTGNPKATPSTSRILTAVVC